jgi:O-antigen/teichoic acid export membrane protein
MSVTRNTLALLISSIAQKAIAFVYFALIARWAGVEDTGKYFFAISWALMFSIMTDLGLTSVLIREVAKTPEKTARILGQVVTIKLPLVAVAAAIVNGGVWLMGYPPVTREMVALASVVLALDAVSLTFYGIMRGHHQLKYEGLGLVIGQIIILATGIAVLKSGAPLTHLMYALIAGSLWNAVMSVVVVRRKLGIAPKPSWDRNFAKELLMTALPFALAGAFVKIYTNADIVLLNRLAGDAAAGIYAVPYKLTFAFQFIPMAFTAALFPAFARSFAADRERLGEVFHKSLWYLSLIVAPLVAGIMALAPELVRVVYGPAYGAAAVPLVILIPTLVFIFLDFPVGSMLNATDRQATQTRLMGLATLISVVLNILLIPRYGVMGVVIASLVSHGFLFVLGLRAVNGFLTWPFGRMFLLWTKIGAAAASMGILVTLLKPHLPLPVSVLAGAVAYPILVLATGAFKIADARELIRVVLRKQTV